MSPRSSSRLCTDPALQSVWPSFRLKASLLCPPLDILPEPSTGCHEHSLSVALSGAAVSWHRPSAHQPAMPHPSNMPRGPSPTCLQGVAPLLSLLHLASPPLHPACCKLHPEGHAWTLFTQTAQPLWHILISALQPTRVSWKSHRHPSPCGTSSPGPAAHQGLLKPHIDTPTLVAHAHLSPAPH